MTLPYAQFLGTIQCACIKSQKIVFARDCASGEFIFLNDQKFFEYYVQRSGHNLTYNWWEINIALYSWILQENIRRGDKKRLEKKVWERLRIGTFKIFHQSLKLHNTPAKFCLCLKQIRFGYQMRMQYKFPDKICLRQKERTVKVSKRLKGLKFPIFSSLGREKVFKKNGQASSARFKAE